MKSGALILILLVVAGVALAGCLAQAPAKPSSREVTVGALVPLTGDWSSKGRNFNAAIELAAEDANAYLAASGSTDRVRLMIEDTATDPAVALEKIKKLYDAGARIVVGPATSAEIASVRDWADQHGMVVIGYASTSPALSIPGDNVYRLVPDDTRQGEAMAAYLNRSGIRVIVPVVRNDTWGTGLLSATRVQFKKNGGTVLSGYRFEPSTRDFSAIARNLSADVSAARQKYDASSVGVYVIGFDELTPLFVSAADDPVLSSVPWFGSDGSAKADVLTRNSTAARFAAATEFSAPVYGVEKETPLVENVTRRVRAATGSEPDGYSLAAYDTVSIAVRALLKSPDSSAAQLKSAVEFTTDYYYGITGYTKLVASGDRAYAFYPFWAVKARNGTYVWEQVAVYKCDPDQPGGFVSSRRENAPYRRDCLSYVIHNSFYSVAP